MFTVSPNAAYSTRLPAPTAPTTTGPVSTPTRTPNPSRPNARSTSPAYRVDLLDDPERGAHGALGVVLVGRRRAEQREHAVAGQVLDGAAERLDRADHARDGVADDRA